MLSSVIATLSDDGVFVSGPDGRVLVKVASHAQVGYRMAEVILTSVTI
jgi:hypothetical protein